MTEDRKHPPVELPKGSKDKPANLAIWDAVWGKGDDDDE